MAYRAPPKKLYLVRANPGIDLTIKTTRKAANQFIDERKALNLSSEGPHYSIDVYVREAK